MSTDNCQDTCHYLHQYPLDNHYQMCDQYLQCNLNWVKIKADIKKNGATYVDISDVLSLFKHLELDENYCLICYLSLEYHGLWGRVAAIKNSDAKAPVFENDKKRSFLIRENFKLPESSAPPMEAIYHDGTNEGYFEAVLCSLFLDAIPERKHWRMIMHEPPAYFKTDWKTFVDIHDWTPRRAYNSIIAVERKFEDAFGDSCSDGKDRIYLSGFVFQSDLGLYHAFKPKDRFSMYQSQIDDGKRYTKERRCCVFSKSSVLIAHEK